MIETVCKSSYWEPASCKEDAKILFLEGNIYFIGNVTTIENIEFLAVQNKDGGGTLFVERKGESKKVNTDYPKFSEYFATKSEMRKLKLQKLCKV